MEKVIHYCWFGGKPLPKLAKKCIKSWKKYLPDYEIIEWNESNFDVNMTNFSKKAFELGKWAFVSDVARIYALKNFGGIYFDTDMILKKNIDYLFDCEVFAGWESEYNVAVGVLASSHKNNELIDKLWNFYQTNDFSEENMYSLSIPTILTYILKNEYGLISNHLENQVLNGNIKIYSRDYFYPISCDDSPSMFTDNTCMIHYYVGSWISKSDQKRIKFQMIFGKKMGNLILDFLVKCKRFVKSFFKLILYPYVLHKRKKNKLLLYENEKSDIEKSFENLMNEKYVIFCNKNWLGTKNATLELFNNVVGINEIHDDNISDLIVKHLNEKNIEFVGFSAFAIGWGSLIKKIKLSNPNIKIKVIWHGSHAMNVEYYDWTMFEEMFRLLDSKIINSIAFVKKSMYDFYKIKGYNVEFIYNTVHLKKEDCIVNKNKNESNFVKVGLYASGDRWVKNFYNQLAAASLIKNAKIDCIPISDKTLKMAKIFKTSVKGLSTPVSREDLLKRLAQNDINFYVTFSECAPLIPLESLELGIPCITSHNHHYWEDSELKKYLIVDENDSIDKIYDKAIFCLEHKQKILELYKEWKVKNDKLSKESVEKFLER